MSLRSVTVSTTRAGINQPLSAATQPYPAASPTLALSPSLLQGSRSHGMDGIHTLYRPTMRCARMKDSYRDYEMNDSSIT